MEKCLSPSDLKLASKAVPSVRSRVVNLKTIKPDIDCLSMCDALKKAFSIVYSLNITEINPDMLDKEDIEEKKRFFGSYEWVYGRNADFPVSIRRRFSWGEISVNMDIRDGLCSEVKVFTDALDHNLASDLENAIRGARLETSDLNDRIIKAGLPYSEDICTLMQELTRR